jgi:hypothetical protein
MKALKFLKNSAGISMVEVMMAVSVMGGLSLTVAQLMKNTSESTKQNEAKQENVSLKGLIQNNLSVPQACQNTFGALISQANLTAMTGTGTVAVPNIRNKVGTGTILYSSTTNLQPLTITTMVLTNYIAAAGTADLVVNSTFKKSTNNVVMVKPFKIPINLNIDNSNPASPVLVNCSSMAISGGEWMLGGNAGTVDGTDYLGTSDNIPLNFKVNNQKAGRITSTGHTMFGYRAGEVNTGTYNSAYGFQALNKNTTGFYNTAVGGDALFSNTTGSENTAVGVEAMRWNTTGAKNTAFGKQAMYNNTTGWENTAFGSNALLNNTTGFYNHASGSNAMQTNTTGVYNLAIGPNALQANSTASENIAIGPMALQDSVSNSNLAIGHFVLKDATTGQRNFGMGPYALMEATTGSFNMGLGYMSLMKNTTGTHNLAIGSNSGWQNVTGSRNYSIGFENLSYLTNGSDNLALGYQSGLNLTSGSRNIFIGHTSGQGVTTANDKLYVNNGAHFYPLIEGTFASTGRYIKFNSTVKLGTPSWGVSLEIPSFTSIRTPTTSSTDRIYIDTRTLFRDGASGGQGFVGIAGGLGIGGGSYWDSTVIPAQGNVQIQGTVGIGTQTPTEKLHVVGNIYTSGEIKTAGGTKGCPSGWWCNAYFWDVSTQGIYYTNLNNTSDRRLKKNIKDLDESFVKKILKLNPVQFEWRKDKKTGRESKGIHYGFIAQEVEAIWPQLVSTSTDEIKTKSLAGTELISPLVKAFQFLHAEMIKNQAMLKVMQEGIETKLEIHDKAILNLENKVKMLEKENRELKANFESRLKKLEAEIINNK